MRYRVYIHSIKIDIAREKEVTSPFIPTEKGLTSPFIHAVHKHM